MRTVVNSRANVRIGRGRGFLLAVLLGMLGCFQSLDRPEQVVGVYDLEVGGVVDSLKVRPDGRYLHIYGRGGGPTVVDSGTWTISHASGEPRIEFADFFPSWRAQTFPGLPAQRGYWSAYAERGLTGSVRIKVDADLGLAYVRRR